MKISYKNKELELNNNSMRPKIYFEQIAEKPIFKLNGSVTDMLILFFANIVAADYKNVDDYDFDECVEWVDANQVTFNKWLLSVTKDTSKKKQQQKVKV